MTAASPNPTHIDEADERLNHHSYAPSEPTDSSIPKQTCLQAELPKLKAIIVWSPNAVLPQVFSFDLDACPSA